MEDTAKHQAAIDWLVYVQRHVITPMFENMGAFGGWLEGVSNEYLGDRYGATGYRGRTGTYNGDP